MCRSTAPPSAEPPPITPADAVLRHEVEGAVRAALDRLPAFDRQTLRPRHQRDLLQRIAAIRHLRRDRVVLALVRERLALERLEDDLDAFLEDFAVGVLVQQRRAEGLDLAGVIAAPDAEDHPPAGQDVGHRVVFRQPQRVPHRHDVEAAADLQVLRDAAQMHRHHQEVRDQLRAFRLEMVLGHPERVVAALVHALGVLHDLVQRLLQFLLRIVALVDRRALVAEILHIGGAVIGAVEFRDHRGSSLCWRGSVRSGPVRPLATISQGWHQGVIARDARVSWVGGRDPIG